MGRAHGKKLSTQELFTKAQTPPAGSCTCLCYLQTKTCGGSSPHYCNVCESQLPFTVPEHSQSLKYSRELTGLTDFLNSKLKSCIKASLTHPDRLQKYPTKPNHHQKNPHLKQSDRDLDQSLCKLPLMQMWTAGAPSTAVKASTQQINTVGVN